MRGCQYTVIKQPPFWIWNEASKLPRWPMVTIAHLSEKEMSYFNFPRDKRDARQWKYKQVHALCGRLAVLTRLNLIGSCAFSAAAMATNQTLFLRHDFTNSPLLRHDLTTSSLQFVRLSKILRKQWAEPVFLSMQESAPAGNHYFGENRWSATWFWSSLIDCWRSHRKKHKNQ